MTMSVATQQSSAGADPVARRISWRQRLGALWRRFALATCAGLVLAGIVHIVTVLLVPRLSERDADTVLRMLGTGGKAELLTPQTATVRDSDPMTVTAICSYDLSTGPVRVVARAGLLPLGLSLHQSGGVGYAITDRAAIRGVLEFIVMTSEQLDERLARDEEGETTRELRIVSDSEQGLIVVRVLAKLPSDRSEAEATARDVACGPAD